MSKSKSFDKSLPGYWTERQAAAATGNSFFTFRNRRLRGDPIAQFYQLGPKAPILYEQKSVLAALKLIGAKE